MEPRPILREGLLRGAAALVLFHTDVVSPPYSRPRYLAEIALQLVAIEDQLQGIQPRGEITSIVDLGAIE